MLYSRNIGLGAAWVQGVRAVLFINILHVAFLKSAPAVFLDGRGWKVAPGFTVRRYLSSGSAERHCTFEIPWITREGWRNLLSDHLFAKKSPRQL